VNIQREEHAEVQVDRKADIDSIDSRICACGFPMFMRLVYVNVRGLRECTEPRRRFGEETIAL
jgi:hypothetical protein